MNTLQLPIQRLEVTLEENAALADIKKALKMIRGIASVRTIRPKKVVHTPELQSQIDKARKAFANGATITCSTPEEMQQFFDSL